MQSTRPFSFLVASVVTITMLASCSETVPTETEPALAPSLSRSAVPTGDYVIASIGASLPDDIAERIAAAGGTITQSFPEIGIAVARANSAGFAERAAAIEGVATVTEDRLMQLTDPNLRVVEFDGAIDGPAESVASLADNEPFYFIQWAPAAIQAPEAWNAGYTGRGVRVAILDGGLYAVHPDLAANVDVAASRSFVPGQPFNADLGTFWHGTHVAGIVGAGDNGVGAIGIAPNATLIGVKVLHGGTGSFSWLIEGVMYAGTPVSEGGAGADVINMSLGALILDAKDQEIKAAIRELTMALDRAMKYAWNNGTTVIAATGNDLVNLDEEKKALSIPAQSQHVISVAATGPLAWAYGNTDFARRAHYTNYGKAVTDLAAPGGDFAYPGNEACTVFRSDGASITNACWVFDMYLSTTRAGYGWAAGTSMASPVTAGVAALIIEKAGGSLHPAQVEAALRQGALDLGKPGKDETYGHGWVNAYRSIR